MVTRKKALTKKVFHMETQCRLSKGKIVAQKWTKEGNGKVTTKAYEFAIVSKNTPVGVLRTTLNKHTAKYFHAEKDCPLLEKE